MSGIKKLAGQTMWYGVSSIAARFLNYLLTPYLTAMLLAPAYGDMILIYSLIPFLNIIFTYGLETAYFRYVQKAERADDVYNTITVSLIMSTISLTVMMLVFRHDLAVFISLKEHPEFITWSAFIIAFDALTTISFAKLRQQGRPIKYATIRIVGILINIGFVIFFLSVCPAIAKKNPDSIFLIFYNKNIGVGYVIIANLIQSAFTFLLLWKEFFSFRWKFNGALWKEIMLYSLPLVIVGFGGMINETFDRIMLGWWSTAASPKIEVAIYGGCYKLSILITLFIQAFRLGAEPFFFKHADGQNPQRIYARVMKFFVIVVCCMFLVVALYLDVWKYFLSKPIYWTGLKVVPILLLANMFLGIYYNLSIWYKLSNKTLSGAWITLIGVVLTVMINYLFIPKYGYMACAWATFACYGTMMVISYSWGQKAYRIPYAWKKLVAYIVIVVLLYFIHYLFIQLHLGVWVNRGFATVILFSFVVFVLLVERKEFQQLPVIGRFLKK
ncbi:MAG: oligosaccharide flippase family protein [Chitinophagaceae bacterium]|nr:oligosaccharide flippase family protein [Chitinophagaceae bacterium]HQV05137.1 oligosaccharide flippase family protein [Chitinophagaceae bacterium]